MTEPTQPRHSPHRRPPSNNGRAASVVVCEDDAATLELLCEHLCAERFGVMPAPSAADALRLCRYMDPDLMVLELSLPDASGLDVLREVRDAERASQIDRELPVILLCGRGGEQEWVRGLELGADDYLVKPFHFPELLARIDAVLRRRAAQRQGTLRVGELVVELEARRAWVEDREVSLSAKEFSLLALLISDSERVFSKRELVETIWGFHEPDRTRALDAHASRLRRKLDPERGRFLVNCWGVGYRLWDGPPSSAPADSPHRSAKHLKGAACG